MQLILIIFIVVVLFLFLGTRYSLNKEGFHFRRQYGSWCNCSDDKTFNQCMDCANCGICIKNNGSVKCVPGDVYGPYDKSYQCKMWHHNDEFSRRLWKNKLKMVKPFS
jgi:hypothetical protein